MFTWTLCVELISSDFLTDHIDTVIQKIYAQIFKLNTVVKASGLWKVFPTKSSSGQEESRPVQCPGEWSCPRAPMGARSGQHQPAVRLDEKCEKVMTRAPNQHWALSMYHVSTSFQITSSGKLFHYPQVRLEETGVQKGIVDTLVTL